jgi:hypothetical protein
MRDGNHRHSREAFCQKTPTLFYKQYGSLYATPCNPKRLPELKAHPFEKQNCGLYYEHEHHYSKTMFLGLSQVYY